MTSRAAQLRAIADGQLGELIDLISAADEAALRRPCAGREKLGDGSIGALAAHTAENYERIATFVTTADRVSTGHTTDARAGHRIPRFRRAPGHRAPEHGRRGPGAPGHGGQYTAADAAPDEMLQRLAAARGRLERIAELTDGQLHTVPPKDSFRFCAGQRTLEQVLAGLLKHQDHQVQTLKAALAGIPY